jgi:Rrf2 family iron-sulfur cluster assembly transcriptional regulator
MKLSLGKRGDYRVRAMLALARHRGEGLIRAQDVADAMDIPASYLPQLLARLVASGLAQSVAGRDGGYRLARPADQITLLEIIEEVEATSTASECVLRGGPCHWEDRCAFHEYWADAKTALTSSLRSRTLADLLAADEELAERYGTS